jgi:hypothetical protein
MLRRERLALTKALKEKPEREGTWPAFATQLRQIAVRRGLGDAVQSRRYFKTEAAARMADEMLLWTVTGNERKTAEWLTKIFFPELLRPKSKPRVAVNKSGKTDSPGEWDAATADDLANEGKMTVIELPHLVKIEQAKIGFRKATTGARLHRPSLRKVILPQRLFVRRLPRRPGGTILVDASGSMGDFNEVTKWMSRQPFGTIAYYAGDGYETGQLFVYARNGWRAEQIVEPNGGDNSVDGKAIDWLLSQDAPRIMVTDRGFCSAADSNLQVARLEVLEKQGFIKVMDYRE